MKNVTLAIVFFFLLLFNALSFAGCNKPIYGTSPTQNECACGAEPYCRESWNTCLSKANCCTVYGRIAAFNDDMPLPLYSTHGD